ncbi:copper homeostasis protein CutC [Devosia sp. Root685]|uniref:copper homeostasis protein CutC n=1 Tax=Devosia sp. Root685 TaxID=1736587 RepID=UPI0006F1F9C4|nr:copper homeostasis protein CutC [Devosia sp. Root685]KRA97756.1 copper homeostasis protein CutC [Devosia sp. Root685]
MTLLEICVDTAAGLRAAHAGGADRIELCSALELGGLTPTAGLMALAADMGVTARVMIRPRAGDFVFTSDDLDMMRADIAAVRALGLEGVVLGANRADGSLDMDMLAALVEASGGLKKTLHRAFDLVPDIGEAIEQAVVLGFDTILTSGRAASAPAGLDDLVLAQRIAAGRITIMAGAGIDASNVGTILAAAPLGAIHGSCSSPIPGDSAPATRLGFVSPGRRQTDGARVAALKTAIGQAKAGSASV